MAVSELLDVWDGELLLVSTEPIRQHSLRAGIVAMICGILGLTWYFVRKAGVKRGGVVSLLLVGALACVVGCEASDAREGEGPTSAVLGPIPKSPLVTASPVVDIPRIPAGETISAVFEIMANRPEGVKVHSISSSCGCMVAEHGLVGTVIAPGKKYPLRVTLDTQGYAGEVNGVVLVTANGFEDAPLRLRVHAYVQDQPRVAGTHKDVIFDPSDNRVPCIIDMSVYCQRLPEATPLELDEKASAIENCQIRQVGRSISKRSAVAAETRSVVTDEVRLAVTPAAAPSLGVHRLGMKLCWKNSLKPTEGTLVLNVQHPAKPDPAEVFVGVLRPNEVTRIPLRIDFRLPDVRMSNATCSLSWVSVNKEGKGEIILTVSAPSSPQLVRGTLELSFKPSGIPPLRIPIRGVVRGRSGGDG